MTDARVDQRSVEWGGGRRLCCAPGATTARITRPLMRGWRHPKCGARSSAAAGLPGKLSGMAVLASHAPAEPRFTESERQPAEYQPRRRPGGRARCRRSASEAALVIAAKRGGGREREELVDSFLPMIAGIARVYRRSTRVDRDELMQEGVVGLLRALERYDVRRGVPFWAYATWWVRQAMQQVVSELSGPLVLSDRALRQLARVKGAQRTFEQRCGRVANLHELAAAAGLPPAQVQTLIRAELRPRPLDEPANAEHSDGMNVGELLSDPSAEDAFARAPHRAFAAELPRLLVRLTERERIVICSRYGIGRREQTLREVADRLGVSAERVRQIEHASLAKLGAAAERRPGEGRSPGAAKPLPEQRGGLASQSRTPRPESAWHQLHPRHDTSDRL
jgi:RNA polymerase primary sigma factor